MSNRLKNTARFCGVFIMGLAVGLMSFLNPAIAADEIVLGLSMGKTGIYSTINKTTEVAVDIAVEEIMKSAGTQFDPSVVKAFARIPKKQWESIALPKVDSSAA